VEYIWGKHFSKGKWGYQKFSEFVSEKVESLEKENMLEEEIDNEIRNLIQQKGNIDIEIEKLNDLKKQKKENEEKKQQQKKAIFDGVTSTIEINYLLKLESLLSQCDKKEIIRSHKEDYIKRFNKEIQLTNEDFIDLIKSAIIKGKEFILK
jgi:hypothetical protein